MKHHFRVTMLLVGIFFVSQVIGLFIINGYIDHDGLKESGEISFSELPYDIERPEVDESYSFWYIVAAIFMGTILLLIIIKYKKVRIWKLWYFLSIVITLTVAFNSFLNELVAIGLALIIGYLKIFKPIVWLHNASELFIYGGLAAIFVPMMNLFSVVMLLILISFYDMYAVWKSKHMIKLAEFTVESKVFAGLSVPYEKSTGKVQAKPATSFSKKGRIKNAVLGGGDIGFPLMFAGVVLKTLLLEHSFAVAFLLSLIVPAVTTVALYILFVKGEKNKFYPAMPFLSIGCFVGYGIVWLI